MITLIVRNVLKTTVGECGGHCCQVSPRFPRHVEKKILQNTETILHSHTSIFKGFKNKIFCRTFCNLGTVAGASELYGPIGKIVRIFYQSQSRIGIRFAYSGCAGQQGRGVGEEKNARKKRICSVYKEISCAGQLTPFPLLSTPPPFGLTA